MSDIVCRCTYCASTYLLLQGTNGSLDDALHFLREYDKSASEMCFRVASTQWNYSTNMTDFNRRRMIEAQIHKARFDKLSWRKAIAFDWPGLSDAAVRRQLKMLITSTRASLPDDKYNEVGKK